MSEEYPDDQDLKVVVEDKYGLKNTQDFLKRNSRILVHARAKHDVAKVFQRSFVGHQKLQRMKDDVLNQKSSEKATAFLVKSEEDDDELLDDLSSCRKSEHVFDENKELEVKKAKKKDEGIDIELSYKKKTATKQKFLSSHRKTVEFTLSSSREDGTRVGRQEYRNADEFRAVSAFFDGWKQKRVQEKRPLVERLDISLQDIDEVSERAELVDNFLQNLHDGWKLEGLLELGIEQDGQSEVDILELKSEEAEIAGEEDIEGDLDEELRRITNAILKGQGLRESEFVSERVDKGDFYFSSFRGMLEDTTSADRIELAVKFKKKPLNTFDLQIKRAAEETDDGFDPKSISPEWRSELQNLFRGKILQYYGELIDKPELFRQQSSEALEDVDGIGETTADRLREIGVKKPSDLQEMDIEDLTEVKGIANEKATTIMGKD